ncbi:hypothetical protein NDU88_005586 [Pleurodeles waltl]|uniref:Uncharacterized protein n=1 Tax=Pleurodeles waltl TaxID=8319 RepID=A0AAV7ULH7_PLEWA|nr:hypothetical protein NDU88_005586 [Pleurodeles waltl]
MDGTMITAKKVAEHVTRNISWFENVQFPEFSEDKSGFEDTPKELSSEESEPNVSTYRDLAPEQGNRIQRTVNSCEAQDYTHRSCDQWYGLRPSPQPSQGSETLCVT